ncbi:MAG: indole-3-glycerol-phosphate synthase [Deltaproteobacteria bacterium]|nr:MAG: indole-3-glycerol-phosphate synthase [Deltaproteobacteria bacterium]
MEWGQPHQERMGLLQDMAVSSRARVDALTASLAEMRERALATPAPKRLMLAGFDLIAECKLRAPSAGELAAPADPEGEAARRAKLYAEAGACAVSVLTEPERFDGDLSHLAAAAAVCPVPVMRKDFLVDPIQVYEGRAHGASGVLLILRMLDDAVLDACLRAAEECDLFVLLEAFDEADLARSERFVAAWTGAQPLLVGVNSRDLVTLKVDPGRLERLAAHLPAAVPGVAESGIDHPHEVGPLATAGYRLALVGSALMRAGDPAVFATALLEEGRRCS